ncbi:MAG: potassium channel protein [Alphaproteobacteria bacterium]|nr:potassium channel protein [Alphaproteobacteria bacterium]
MVRTALQDPRAQRLVGAAGLLFAVLMVGAGGYDVLGQERWTAAECIYMAVITVSTVGYGETLAGLHDVPGAVAWTTGLIILGSGSMLYFASAVTAFIVEGDLGGAVRRRRMQRTIDGLSGHLIVCGAGSTGRHVLEELEADDHAVVIIDKDQERLDQARRDFARTLYQVVGDATEDDVLLRAGISRAAGLVLALTEDRDNVYGAVTARALAPRLHIVAKAVEPGSEGKLRRAGADDVVSPTALGGAQLASHLVRPGVVDFFGRLLRGDSASVGLHEVEVPGGSAAAGCSLGALRLRERADVLVIGVRPPGGEWLSRPGSDTVVPAGAHMVVMGDAAQVARLRKVLAE